MTINEGASVTLDNSTANISQNVNVVNRLAAVATMSLNGGTFNFLGSNISGLAAAQALASVALLSGSSTISSTQNSGTAAITFTTLTRTAGATVNLVGADSALTSAIGNQIIVGTALATTASATTVNGGSGDILGYATVSGPGSAFDFATFNSITTGVTAFGGYQTAIGSINANGLDVFKATGSVTWPANTVVAGLLIAGSGITINGATVGVGVPSATAPLGAVLVNGSSSDTISANLDFPNGVEGVINTSSGSSVSLSGSITGNTGLTISGAGTVTLPNTNGSPGTVTGVPVSNAGVNYTAAPTVTFSGGGATTQATGYAVLNAATKTVTAIVITSPGVGYTAAPTVALGAVAGTTTTATAGTVTFSNGYYTGVTTVNTSLTLGAINAIPGSAGAIALTNGTITLSSITSIVVPNPVSLNSNISSLTLTGGSFTFNGAVSAPVAGGNVTLNLTNPSDTATFYGAIAATVANVTKQGQGKLVLAAANVYTGLTNILNGIVLATASGATSFGVKGAIVANGATLQFQQLTTTAQANNSGPITIVGNGFAGTTGALEMLAGGTSANAFTGAMTLLGDTTISVDAGSLNYAGAVSGAAALTKVGSGLFELSVASTYNGLTTVNNGILYAAVAGSLGAITAGTVVNNGATLDVGGAIVGEPITLYGSGFGGVLPLGDISGLPLPRGTLVVRAATTLSGNVTLGTSNVVINVDASTLGITGIVSGTNLTLVGAAAQTLTLSASNTFTGNVNIESGILTLANQNVYAGTTTIATQAKLNVNVFGTIGSLTSSGTLSGGSTTYNVSVGAVLTLDDSVNNLPSRINSLSSINLTAATLSFIGNNTALVKSSQTVGTVSLLGGNSAISNTSGTGNGTTTLTIGTLVRASTSGATVNFVPVNTPLGSSFNQILLNQITQGTTGSPTTTTPSAALVGNGGGILPWAYVNTDDFATYNANSPGGVLAFTNYVSSIGASTSPGDIVKVTASEVLIGNETIGALVLAAGVTVTESGYTLTLGSGTLLTAASSTITGGTLAFGNAEGVITTAATQTTTINSVVTGNDGLTIASAGTGTVGTVTLAAANSISGNTAIGGSVTLGSAASIASGNITITGSTNTSAAVTLQATQAVTFGSGQLLTLNNVNLTFGNTNAVPITFNGQTTLVGFATLTQSDTGGVYFNGQITDGGSSSPGTLILAGAQTVFLTNPAANNNYLGGTVLNGATVVVGDSNAFGTNGSAETLAITSGTIVAAATVNFQQTLVLNGNFTLSATSSAYGITFSGNGALTASTTITDNDLNTVTLSGNLTELGGAFVLTMNGPGVLSLTGNNTYTGGTTLNATSSNAYGTLSYGNSNALGLGTITLTTGVLNSAVPNGSLTSVTSADATVGGSGYSQAPTVSINGGGSSATASATLAVTAVTITAGGSGYTLVPTVTFSTPGTGVTATGIAVVSNGVVTAIIITNDGSGYTSMPTITFGAVSGAFRGHGDCHGCRDRNRHHCRRQRLHLDAEHLLLGGRRLRGRCPGFRGSNVQQPAGSGDRPDGLHRQQSNLQRRVQFDGGRHDRHAGVGHHRNLEWRSLCHHRHHADLVRRADGFRNHDHQPGRQPGDHGPHHVHHCGRLHGGD